MLAHWPIWRVLLLACLMITPVAAPVGAQDAAIPALARVDLSGPLAVLGNVPVYAHLRDTRGQEFAFVIAPPAQLAATGQAFRILDPDARGSVYWLALDRRGANHPALPGDVQVVYDDGRYLIVRGGGAVGARLAELGLSVQPLNEARLPVEAPMTQLAPAAITPLPSVQEMVGQVEQTAVRNLEAGLTGDAAVTIGGQPYTFTTRHTTSGVPIAQATQYVYEYLQGLGLNTSYHYWTHNTYSGRNVIGEKPGLVRPGEIVLVVAHIDDMPSVGVAPGADDNASGSTGVMTAARILSQYQFERTLRFIFFSGEEQGMYGSAEYAAATAAQNIVSVLNLDMISWNASGGPVLRLHTRPPGNAGYAGDLAIANLFGDVVNAYGLSGVLTPVLDADGLAFSDHSSFWNRGRPALLAIEDDVNDWNAYYHTRNDALPTINIAYFTNFVRAAVGTAAHLASPVAVRVTKTAGSPVIAGAPLTYTLHVTNTGAALSSLALADRVPANTVFLSASQGGVLGGNVAQWALGALGSNAAASRSLVVRAGCLPNSASIVNDDYSASPDAWITRFSGAAVTVQAQPLAAAFTAATPALAGWPVRFSNLTQGAAGYGWNFGDGTTATAASPAHTYAQKGTYAVTLRADNPCGSATTVKNLTVDDYGVTLSPVSSSGHARPDRTITYALNVVNTGTLPESYRLSAGAHAWNTVITPAVVGPLAPGASAPATVVVTVPGDAPAGNQESVAITAAAEHDPRPSPAHAAAQVISTADPIYAAQILPASASGSADPEHTLTYQLRVLNAGNAADTFAVSVDGWQWPTVAAAQSAGPLAPGESAALDVIVTVPAGAAAGATDRARVQAVSQHDAEQVATAWLTSRASLYYDLEVAPLVARLSGRPGGSVAYTIMVTNTGRLADTYAVQVGPHAWPASPAAASLPVGAHGVQVLNVTVQIPMQPTVTSDQVAITLTSAGDPGRQAAVTLITRWGDRTALPLVVKGAVGPTGSIRSAAGPSGAP